MKRRRLIVLALSLVFMVTSVQVTFAKDVTDNWNKAPNVSVGVTQSDKFEKKNDADCYTFISGGGSYKIKFYSKDPGVYDDLYEEYELPVEITYSQFEYFSPVAGDPPDFYPSSIHDIVMVSGHKSGSWYVATENIGKFKRGYKVGIRFTGYSKCKYKFKIIGKNSPSPGTPTLKSAKGGKKSIKAKWGKKSSAKGYQIQYAKNSSFSSAKKVNVKGNVSSKSFKVSSSGKYYVRVRSWKRVMGERSYSKWSKAKTANVR